MGLSRPVSVDPIKIIKNFILDAYDEGLSIFQELVQNANDASSSELIFSFLPDGIPGSINLLLSSPCLLVINDGPFRQEDADIISDVGIGTKASDSNTIGKFGLGLKSIYHWCEAFYFFTTNGKYSALVNPYYNTGKHAEWDYRTEKDEEVDMQLLLEVAISKVEKKKTYFVIAIPLRTKRFSEPYIKKTFYDKSSIKRLITDKSNADEEIRDSFVTMLSTLAVTSKKKTLKSVRFVADDYYLDCSLTEHGVAIRMNDKEKFTAGYKSIKCDIGTEDKKIIESLQKSPNWPTSDSLDEDGNTVKAELLTAEDSSLILIKTQNTGKTGYLKLCYATYLPLKAQDMVFTTSLPGSQYSYTLVFNASFSIDSGRNGISGYREILSSPEEFPRTYAEFNSRIEECNDEKEILKLWNVFLLRNILFPELPKLFFAEGVAISESDMDALFTAFKEGNKTLRSILFMATTRYSIPKTLAEDGRFGYELVENSSFIPLPYPNPALQSSSDFKTLVDTISKDKRIAFYNKNHQITGFSSEGNMDLLMNEENLALVLNLLKGPCSSLLSSDSIYPFLELFYSYYLASNPHLAPESFECILTSLKLFLARLTDGEEILGLPTSMYPVLVNVIRILKSSERVYLRLMDSTNCDAFWTNWFDVSGRIILYPECRCSKEGEKEKGSRITDFASYLKLDVLSLLELYKEPELAGDVFSSTVLNCLEEVSYDTEEFLSLFREVFENYKIIPATCYSKEGDVKSYISFTEVENAYQAIFNRQDIRLLYNFVTDYPETYFLTKEVCSKFGIIYTELSVFNLEEAVKSTYSISSFALDKRYAEEFLLKLITSQNYNGMKTCPIFPANDGRFVRLSDQNTFLDIREDKRVRIVPSSKACSIIEIESSALRINFELYYKGQCITKENFLEKYLSYSSSYDSYVIFDNSLYWSRPEVKSLLKEKKWYERGGVYYSAGEMLVASRISDATLEAIGARCLLLSEATVDNDPYLKKLYEKGFIARRLSEVPEGILINDCYPDAFSILLTDSNGNIDKNRTLEIFNQLIELETRIDDKSHPLYRWGMFLKDLVTTSEFIEKEKLNELFIKYNRLVSGRRNSTLIKSACTDMIKALDSQVEKRQELFFYLLTYVENGALFKLNAKELSNVEFPSEDRRWKKLSLLCDPRKIVSIEKASKLHHNINSDIFSLETEGPSIVVIRRKEALLSRLEKLFPNAAKPLLGMLLFLTNTREGKAEAQNLDFAGSEENYYLKVLQSSYRHVDYLTNHYKGHPASEVFSSASVNYKRPTIEYTEEEKEGEIEITSITGARIKVRLAEEAQRDTAFSRLESYSDCRFEVFLNRLESGRNTDSQVVELIQKILELVYGQTKSFREALLELVGISKKEMDKTQFLVRSELVNVLKQISRSRSTNYGAEIAHYIDSYQKLDRSLHAASYENKRNPEAEKRKEEITNQIARKLTEDRGFASYVLEAMCRHMQTVSYAPENVPYEFFQNADDACLQRSTYEKAEEDYYYDIRFTDAGLLVIEHNGRPINKCPEGREYEDWRNDFINMLSFSSSKGGDEDNRETGKFGFGFKSCYFLTDEPKVYSANLSARIVAGIYPVYTDPDNRLSSSVTRFVLPVKNSMQAEIKDIMASFKRDIPSMLLFAKAIRRITINSESYEKKILASAECYKIVSIGNLVYLLLDGEHGQIAFSLSENRIRTQDTKMKKLWCTTPLGITSATSYLVNSTEFIIDVGRNQLALNIPGNKRLVTGYFASKMTALLIDLYEKKLPMEVGRYLAQGEEGTKLLLEAIASSSEDEIFTPIFEKTYSAFVSKYDKCYSGNDFRHIDSETCCVRLDNLNFENTTRKELFDQILDLVNEHYKGSHSFIFFTKKAFVPSFCNPEVPEGIGTLIRKLIKGYSDKLSVSTQLKLSRLMVMSGYPMDFTGFKFESEAGSYEYPTSLVWKSEGYLYELAPKEKRAREEYEYEGRYCFNSSEVASWIIEVKEDKRDIAMRVLSDNVSSLVSEKHTLTNSRCWLSSSWRRHLSLVDSSYLPLLEGFFKVSPVLSNSEKDEYVKRVYECWDRLTDKERQEAIENYRENTYGKRRLELRGDSDDWYQLLYITVLGSMGRFRSKAHINFVNRFMAKKYSSDNYLDYKNTDMFENPKVMNDWLNYMIRTPMNEEGSGYEEWRKYLPFFAQISYSASKLYNFLIMEPLQNSYYYSLSYRDAPEASGSGFIEPDFKHALGRFYPMVLRELISNNCSGLDEQVRELMNRESFYPNRELREILSLEEEGRLAAKQFYEKCYSFMNKNQRYVRYLFDGSYPFYYYQYQKDNAGRSIDFDLYGSGEES